MSEGDDAAQNNGAGNDYADGDGDAGEMMRLVMMVSPVMMLPV